MVEETPELSINQQEVQIETPSFLDKVKIHKFKVLGGILGVLVFAGAVFGAYKIGQRQVQPGPQSTPTPAAMATPTPDPTANWKTYTNTKYGYSIKYPDGTKIYEGGNETVFDFWGPRQLPDTELFDGFGMTMGGVDNKENKSPRELAESLYRESQKNIQELGRGDITKCKIEDIVRGGVEGARFTYCIGMPGSGILNFSEWFIHKGNTITIYAVLANEPYLETFNLMLSTFRFLE